MEFPTFESRRPWTSAPGGAYVPIYLLAKIRGHEPTPSMVMTYNLANHLLIALFLSLTIFFFLSWQLGFSYFNSFLFSTIPIYLDLFLPGPFWWHQNAYAPHTAVILPFVLVIFLEVIRPGIRNKFLVNLLQGAVIFCGFLIDWLFVFIAIFLYLYKIARAEIPYKKFPEFLKKSTSFWLVPIAAFSIYGLQLYIFNAFSKMWSRFVYRTALSEEGQEYTTNFFTAFWGDHIGESLGRPASIILWLCLLIFLALGLHIVFQKLLKKETPEDLSKITLLIGLLLLPCFSLVYFFTNTAAIHKWMALPFSIPFATIPFVLLPAAFLVFIGKNSKSKKQFLTTLVALTMIVLSGVYLINVYSNYHILFPGKTQVFDDKAEAAQFILRNTSYDEMVFSPNFQIYVYPPQLLQITMKRVYKVDSVSQIQAQVKNVEGDFSVDIFLRGEKPKIPATLKDLLPLAYDVIQEDNFLLYKIKSDDILNLKTSPANL